MNIQNVPSLRQESRGVWDSGNEYLHTPLNPNFSSFCPSPSTRLLSEATDTSGELVDVVSVHFIICVVIGMK